MKLDDKRKAFVDELFKNGFNQAKAYQKIYNINNPNYAKSAGSRLMTYENVRKYYDHKFKEYRKKLDIDKQKMLDMLMDEINLFDEMKYLAKKDDITEEEIARLNRLAMLLKGSDINKSRDMINKMIGAYEAEKQEVKHTGLEGFKVTIQLPKKEDEDDKGD